MKRLIVQGDDLGYSTEITDGILYSYENGILTTTSVMINLLGEEQARYLNDRISNLKNNSSLLKPKLHIGIHLNLTFGKPLSPFWPQDEFMRPDKNIKETQWKMNVWIEYFAQFKADQVETELRLQAEKALKYFDNIDHLDSHHFAASYEPIKSVYEKLAVEYKLAARPSAPLKIDADGPEFKLDKDNVRVLREKGIKCPDNLLLSYYNQKQNPAADLIADIKDSNSSSLEFMSHPSKGENAQNWRKADLQILVDPSLKEYVRNNIQLITYSDL